MATSTMTRPTPAKPAATLPGVSFSLALDQASYLWTPQARTLTATLVLRCAAPMSLAFTGGQEFDVAIHDAAGRQVALWSAGQAFFDHVQTISVTGERRWTATMPLPEASGGVPPMPGGAPLRPAAYTATGYLTMAAGPVQEAGGRGGVVQPDRAVARPPVPSPIPFPPPVLPPVATPSMAPSAYSATVGFTVHADPVVLDQAPKASA